MKISFIFPSYVVDEENRKIELECLRSFEETVLVLNKSNEIIFIDNGSVYPNEFSRDIASIYVRTVEPLGFARAVNMGFKIASGDIIGVLNNDLLFKTGWLEPLLEVLQKGEAEAVAPAEEVFDGLLEQTWSSCFFLKRETREQIGLFDEVNLPYRYHDQDYWIRAKKLGFRFRRCGKSLVSHKESTTFNKMPIRDHANQEESQIMLARWGVTMADQYQV